MSRVLVTGGSGFIGTNLVEHYHLSGDHVTNLDIVPPRNPHHTALWRKTDILDSRALRQAVIEADPEIVFHMAARTDLEGVCVDDYSANTEGVFNLIEALHSVPTPPLTVFASSMLVCSVGYKPNGELDYCPNTTYGESKVVGEQLVRKEAAGKFPWVIIRPTSIWGPWFETPYCDFFMAVRRGLYMHPRGINIYRSYGFVLNSVVQLARLASSDGAPLIGRTVYLADYKPIELKHWAETIQLAMAASRIREIPLSILKLLAKSGDMLKAIGYARPPLNSFRLSNLLTEVIHDTSPLHLVCGDLPYSMEQGVRITCDWLNRNSI